MAKEEKTRCSDLSSKNYSINPGDGMVCDTRLVSWSWSANGVEGADELI